MLESVIASGLMIILMATAIPNFTTLGSSYNLRQTSHQIAAEFQRTRMRAIARNARYRFTYDASTRTYTVERESAPGIFVAEYSNQLPTGVTLGTIATPPIFDSRGMLNATTNIPVTVQGGTHTRTVTINVLGQVSFS
ncbi:MAG: GspH/FimT family pseudopilin [Candidatus Binatia bacterium]